MEFSKVTVVVGQNRYPKPTSHTLISNDSVNGQQT